MNPKYPVFIPSKGRYDSRLTIKMFDELKVPYTVFVEKQEYDQYAKYVREDWLHILPHKDKGLTVTRNYIWDYAASQGYERFWTFDDNISSLWRFNKNYKHLVTDGTPLCVIEDFVNRYENIAIAGMHYMWFLPRKQLFPPFFLNTRVYSNMLIKTDIKDPQGKPYRNVTFYNDDTDLCLRVMKDGWVTVLFNAFLINKATTMTIKGGMTDYYVQTEKRKQFVNELIEAHPDVVTMKWKYGRWHHQVDYTPFKKNKLIFKPDYVKKYGVNNYGLQLIDKNTGKEIIL